MKELDKEISLKYGILHDNNGLLCPFHGDKKSGSFHVTILPEKGIFYHCFSCGAKGSEYTLRIELAKQRGFVKDENELLFSKVKDLSSEERLKRKELLDTISSSFKEPLKLDKVLTKVNRVDRNDENQIYNLDLVYKTILKILTLSESDKKYLLNRKITQKNIINNNYKSLLIDNNKVILIIEKALDELIKNELITHEYLYKIPGVYKKGTKPSFRLPKIQGILIPIMLNENIVALQVRSKGIKEGLPRYFWISSKDLPSGTAAGSAVMSTTIIDYSKPFMITEGHFKAITLSNEGLEAKYNILSIQGIGNGKDLIPILSDYQVNNIVIAFDNDIFEKRNGKIFRKNQILSWLRVVKEKNPKVNIIFLKWKDKKYKGIDDLIFAKGSFANIKDELNHSFIKYEDF